jgi:hypothetical protein
MTTTPSAAELVQQLVEQERLRRPRGWNPYATLPARVAKLEAVVEAVRNVIPADAYDATRSFRREWVALHAALAALDVTP